MLWLISTSDRANDLLTPSACLEKSQLASHLPASALYVNYAHCCQANQPRVNAASASGGGGSSSSGGRGNMVTIGSLDIFQSEKQTHGFRSHERL